jgi:RNA polymerase sigma-70 factor (ECF subfamily)
MHPQPTPTPGFEALAREYSPQLLRFLRRQIGDAAAAEDLLQETLLRIARGLAGFAGRSSLKTWVFAIASNVVGDYLRAPSRWRRGWRSTR